MSFSDQLKSQLNIVDVIGQYVRLKRSGAGASYTGLCPFHPDKTPSFNVHSVNQFYKCFGCEAGGDVFKFVMEIESLTFPETLKLLAERYGIAMPERQRSDDPEEALRNALLEMHEIAAEVFQSNLRGAKGAEARQYLETRGVSRAAQDEFRLGVSDPSGQQLVSRFQKFGQALLSESGLVRKRNDAPGFYDIFRNRLMFPIHSESGKVIAFGGRALRPEDEPKYINSSETKIYKKKAVLYNLHRAKTDARKRDRMILVEGYMDVIGVYSAGVHEVVAVCGTALSTDHVRTVKRQVAHSQTNPGQVIINFDPDSAGARSTEKHIATVLAEGLRVRVLSLPGGLDPDEYINAHGATAYEAQLQASPSYFHWLASRAREKFDMHTVEGRIDAFKSISPAIQQVHDRLERAAIANEVAEYLKIDREVVRENFRRMPAPEPAQKSREISSTVPANERLLLACLLCSKDAREAIMHYLQSSAISSNLEMKAIFDAALSLDKEGAVFSVEALSGKVEPRLARILAEITFGDGAVHEENALDQALHCLRALEAKSARVECDRLRRRIHELERTGDFGEALKLADELNRKSRTIPEA